MTDESVEKIPILDLDRLKIVCPLGRGAKGVVFRVRVSGSDEDLALKVVLKASIRSKNGSKSSSGSSRDCDKTGLGRVGFEREVLRCLRHPLLPSLRGVLETENIVGYAIDYCPGQDLNCLRQLQSDKMFSQEFIRFYGAELVLALEHLHTLGIVYRDLKPGNILIQENGHLMLVDFDLSTKLAPRSPVTRFISSPDPDPNPEPLKKKTRFPMILRCFTSDVSESDSEKSSLISGQAESDSGAEKSNSFVGTEDYVAPEIIAGNGHDYGVDWWSLGVVMYEMLYGTAPFRGANRKETFCKIVTKAPDLAGETTPLRGLIGRLLEKDPLRRAHLEEIKGHEFFSGVDWEMIWQIQRPPFIPEETVVEEDMEGIKGIDVESFVRGIFDGKKEGVLKSDDSGENNKSKRVWVEGLVQANESENFSVY